MEPRNEDILTNETPDQPSSVEAEVRSAEIIPALAVEAEVVEVRSAENIPEPVETVPANNKKISLYDMVAIGLMAAVVFVVTMFLSIRVPTPTGTVMIKLANAFILLSGLLLGSWRGGLAAGFGSMIFDLMTPEYVPEAWLTFVRFFLMAYICGAIAHAGGANAKKWGRNLLACVVSAVFSSIFYAAKNILVVMFGGSALIPAIIANTLKLAASVPNMLIAVTVAMALLPAMQRAFSGTTLGQRAQMQN